MTKELLKKSDCFLRAKEGLMCSEFQIDELCNSDVVSVNNGDLCLMSVIHFSFEGFWNKK